MPDWEPMKKQVVSKERVADYGEVLTGEREVNAMLDLVKAETERIEARFLEPACGTGNFLTEILRRKLAQVEKTYRRSQLDYERNLVSAVSSVYGIDILEDNVRECRKRLYEIANERYTTLFKEKARDQVCKVIRFLVSKNIIWGDALTLWTVGPARHQIIFSQWSFPFHNSLIKRSDFVFAELISDELIKNGQLSLLARNQHVSDSGKAVFIPTETRSDAPVHFLKIADDPAL